MGMEMLDERRKRPVFLAGSLVLLRGPGLPDRDLRMAKLQQKISGCFRSKAGAERSAHLRSYLGTTRKDGVSAMDALTRLFKGDPWMPPEPT